jgi:hypothetical protein
MPRLLSNISLPLVICLTCTNQVSTPGFSQSTPSKHEVRVFKSHLKIIGTTNVSTFECTIPDQQGSKPLAVSSTWSDRMLKFNGLTVAFPIAQFDCGNKMMNHDLQKLLEADAYPQIILRIKNIYVKPQNTSIEQLRVTADVEVTMSGKLLAYQIYDGEVLNLDEDKMIFKGCQQIKFSDFELSPPEKLMGLIKTQDALTIEFEIGLFVTPR